MLRRYSHFFSCLLLVLVPLQSIAAANIYVCNHLIEPKNFSEENSASMPCHKYMVTTLNNVVDSNHCKQKNTCKSDCTLLCASVAVMATLAGNMAITAFPASSSLVDMLHQSYASIIQPKLQRPPIYLS